MSCPKVGSFIASLLAMLCSGAALAAPEIEGRYKIEASVQGVPVVVIALIDDSRICSDPQSVRWGAEGECPRHRVSALYVKGGGIDGLVPMSAYSDLAALRRMEIGPANGGFELRLLGGDAATGYTAVLRFSTENPQKRPILVSRTVRSSTNAERSDQFNYRFSHADAGH